MKPSRLGYFDLQNRQFHRTRQCFYLFSLLKSYFRDNMLSQIDSTTATNIHGNLQLKTERQIHTNHFPSSIQALPLIMHDSSAHCPPPSSHLFAVPEARPLRFTKKLRRCEHRSHVWPPQTPQAENWRGGKLNADHAPPGRNSQNSAFSAPAPHPRPIHPRVART